MPERNLGVSAIFLVGFMGSGKTSVGRVLSRQLGWRFEDLDEQVQLREGRRIAQIFEESGEAEFRRAELAALRELLAKADPSDPAVVALGGGAFIHAEIAELIEASGFPAVFLDAPVSELWRRCQSEPVVRPLRKDERQFRRLYDMRRPHYAKAGMHMNTHDKKVEHIAAEIAANLGLPLKSSG